MGCLLQFNFPWPSVIFRGEYLLFSGIFRGKAWRQNRNTSQIVSPIFSKLFETVLVEQPDCPAVDLNQALLGHLGKNP